MPLDDAIRLDPVASASGPSASGETRQGGRRLSSKLFLGLARPVVDALAQIGLGGQLLILILLPLLPLLTLTAVVGLSDRHEQTKFAAARAGLLAQVLAARMGNSLHAAAELGQGLRSRGGSAADGAQCGQMLQQVGKGGRDGGPTGLAGLTVFGGDGSVRCTSMPPSLGGGVSDRNWFVQAAATDAGQVIVRELQEGRLLGRDVVVLASALQTGDPAGGVIAVALDLDWLADLAAALSVEKGAAVLVIDRRDGTVIGGGPEMKVLRGHRFPGHPLTERVVSGSRYWTGTLPDYGGIPRVFGLAAVGQEAGFDATVAVGLPKSGVLAADIRLATGLAGVVLLTVPFALVAWRLSSGVLLQPLRHLTEQVRGVHLGDLSVRPRPAAKMSGEISRLFDNFDAMSAALRAREDALAASRAELAASEEHHRVLAESATDMITRFDANLVRVYVSPACRDVLGYEPEELVGHPPQAIVHPDDVARVDATLNNALKTGQGETRAVYRALRKDGREIWLETSGRRLPGGVGAVVVTRDVSERKRFEASLEVANCRLEQLARLDALTTLNNRRSFDERLTRQAQECVDAGTGFALMLFDVDWFKSYNDTYGHQAGDECLRAVAVAARTVLRDTGDFAARYGGEEFAVILPDADEAAAALVAERVIAALAAAAIPHLASPLGRVTVSLGIAAVAPETGRADPNAVIARADCALYQAKNGGRNGVCIATGAG